MDKRAAKIRKMTEEVSKTTTERFAPSPVKKGANRVKNTVGPNKKPVSILKTMDTVSKTTPRLVSIPVQKKGKVQPQYRRGKTRRMEIQDVTGETATDRLLKADSSGTIDEYRETTPQHPRESSSQPDNLWDDIAFNNDGKPSDTGDTNPWNEIAFSKSDALKEEVKKSDVGIDIIDTEPRERIPDWIPDVLGSSPGDSSQRQELDENRPEQKEFVRDSSGNYIPKPEEPKSTWNRVKDNVHDRYTKAGGATGIARSAIDVAKDGLHSKDVDINSMTSDQKDEIARTLGGYSGRTDAEITTSLRQIDNTIAQYNTAISKKKEEFSQAEITVREKGNAAHKAKLERDRAQREYNNLLSSWSRMKPGPEKDQLESTITTKANDLLKAETDYNEKDEERVREERNKARIQNELDDIGRKITNTVEKKKELVNDKNLLLTALYRGLANKKKEEVGLYKKFKREMSERGKTMTGMGNMLSAKGVEWNDKLLAKPGSGAADGVSRIVGRNVGYHPSRSVTDVVVGSTNNNRNRALVDSLTTIYAGRSVTPLGAPGSVHDGIGRQIQPTVRAGQVQMPQLSAPRLAGRPGQGMGKLTVNLPDVRSFGSPQQSAPQPSQPPVQQPVTAEMPKMGDFGKESITTFRKANNQMRFVFGDRKSNKGKRKHK